MSTKKERKAKKLLHAIAMKEQQIKHSKQIKRVPIAESFPSHAGTRCAQIYHSVYCKY